MCAELVKYIMASDHKNYVKNYIRSHKNGAPRQEALKSRYPVSVKAGSDIDEGPSHQSTSTTHENDTIPESNDNAEIPQDQVYLSSKPETESISKPSSSGNAAKKSPSIIPAANENYVIPESKDNVNLPKGQSARDLANSKPSNSGNAAKNPLSKAHSTTPGARPKTAGKRGPTVKPPIRPMKVNNRLSKTLNHLLSLPDELQLKILSYLSPGDLLVCARVSKHWNYLANDNVLWKTLFDKLASKKAKSNAKAKSWAKSGNSEEAFQYWKWQCVKRCTEDRNQVLKLLSKIDNYTGLPKHTDKCLQTLAVQWRLSFVDTDSIETYINHRDVFYHRISISVRWYDLEMPPVNRLKRLRLYAGCPVFFENNKPLKNSACQMSLLYEFNLDWSRVVSSIKPVAADDRIELRILSPLMIATWKDGGEIAFISACLHNNNLVEVCLEANRRRAALQILRRPKPVAYTSMFGYNITMELRNQRQSCWSDQFRSIYFDKEQIALGKAVLKLILSDHNFKHTPIRSKLEMPWKTDLFKNILKNVTILDLVLQDEQNKPVWCVRIWHFTLICLNEVLEIVVKQSHLHVYRVLYLVSDETPTLGTNKKGTVVWTCTPVNIAEAESATTVVYDYDGVFCFIDYEDGVGHLHMELVWRSMAQYSARFIKDFATISEPLQLLTHKNAQWHFGPTEMTSFNRIRNSLTDVASNAYFDPAKDTVVLVDESPAGGLATRKKKLAILC